jgi:serine/threonine protein kinase
MYRQVKQLGRGAFGTVWLCNDQAGNKVAVKFIPCDHLHKLNEASKEAALLHELDHPNIVRCFDHFIQSSKFCLVLEYCGQGTLSSRLKKGPLPYDVVMKWTLQLLSSLSYLHSMGVIHRDIKPDNILITDNGDIKIADFGLSRLMEAISPEQYESFSNPEPNFVDDYAATVCGTKIYMAPEVFDKHYNDKADVFSMGLVIYVMITRSKIKAGKKEIYGLVHNNVFIGQALKTDPNCMDDLFTDDIWKDEKYNDLQELIDMMLTPDYQQRPSSQELQSEEEEEIEDVDHEGSGIDDYRAPEDEHDQVTDDEEEDDMDKKRNLTPRKGLSLALSIGADLLTILGTKLLT